MTWTKFFGWCVAASVMLALLNFSLKQINREYGRMLSAWDPGFAGRYKTFMRFMVKNHRFFGMSAIGVFAVHFGSVWLSGTLSVTGAITGMTLLAAASLGGYGFYINRNYRAVWLTAHRGSAFLLAVCMVVHIMDRIFLFVRL
ncbi:MAG: hypothetical protein ABFD70_09295 [Syntrophaceae bacterium]|nr:hypothetical protein [Deltaproteobacteria bacterium]